MSRVPVRLPGTPVSGILRPRAVAVCVAAGAATFAALVLNVSVGDFPVPLADVARALVGAAPPGTEFIVTDLRLPRSLAGALVGAALGIAGAITQAVTRNPLASPDILGVTAGAGAAAVATIVLGGGAGGRLPAAALVGGGAAAVALLLLAWRGGVSGGRLVLVGIALHVLLTSGTNWLLVRAQLTEAQQAAVWLVGSLNGRGWEQVRTVGFGLLVLVPVVLVLTRHLGVLQFGDDTARGLGLPVERSRLGLVLVAVALASLATAAAGPIGFVALGAPRVALWLARTPGIPVFSAALVGALLVVASDLVARRVLAPTELPVGVVTAVLGAPFLLLLLSRTRRITTGG